jgi:hypothetical protein
MCRQVDVGLSKKILLRLVLAFLSIEMVWVVVVRVIVVDFKGKGLQMRAI